VLCSCGAQRGSCSVALRRLRRHVDGVGIRAALLEHTPPSHALQAAKKFRAGLKNMAEVHIHRDKKKAAEFETIDYLPQDSQQYRRWLQTQPMNQQWDRWTMMFLVGVVVGLCAFFLHSCFSTLAKWKARRSQPPSAALLTCRGADEHAARHRRAQRGTWLVVQR